MPRRPRSRRRQSHISSPAATCWASPRRGPARPLPLRCRFCSASPPGTPPALARKTARCLVLTPTRELALQIRDSFKRLRAPSRAACDSDIRRRRPGAAGRRDDARRRYPGRDAGAAARPDRARSYQAGSRRDIRARRSRPHARHGLHSRRQKDRRDAAEPAPDLAVLGDDAARHRPACGRRSSTTRYGSRSRRRRRPSNRIDQRVMFVERADKRACAVRNAT